MQKIKLTPYLLILPFTIFFIVFRFLPTIQTIMTSLITKNSDQLVFVGVNNIKTLLFDSMFYKSIYNTAIIYIFYIFMKVPYIIFMAHLINSTKHKKIFLFLIYLPTLVGMFAYAIVFRFMFTYNGMINSFLEQVLQIKLDWFGNSVLARLMISIAVLWGSSGFYILLYANALKDIPNNYYDVLSLESDRKWHKYIKVEGPLLYPIMKTIMFLSLLEIITLVDLPINLTLGGPYQATVTVSYYVYIQAIQYNNFGYAATIGFAILVITIMLFSIKKNRVEVLEYEIY